MRNGVALALSLPGVIARSHPQASAATNLPFPPCHLFHPRLRSGHRRGRRRGAVARVLGRQRRAVGRGGRRRRGHAGDRRRQLRSEGLALLRAGMTPDAIIKAILDSDPDPGYRPDWPKAGRQFAVMDAKGNYAAYTGPKATTWAGNKGGQVLHRAGQHPRRRGRGRRTWSRPSRRPRAICRCG